MTRSVVKKVVASAVTGVPVVEAARLGPRLRLPASTTPLAKVASVLRSSRKVGSVHAAPEPAWALAVKASDSRVTVFPGEAVMEKVM